MTEFARIPPTCKACKVVHAASELVQVNGLTLCVPCANKAVPGGVKNIWSQPL